MTDFPNGVPVPRGASYAAPLLDFSPIGDLPKTYREADEQQSKMDQRRAFRNGIPKTASGLPDYSAMADTLAKAGAGVDTITGLTKADIEMQILQQGADDARELGGLPPRQRPAVGPQSSLGAGGDYFARTGQQEGSGSYSAPKNPNSTAIDKYQFTEGTRADVARDNPELGLPGKGRYTPEQQEAEMRAFTSSNAKTLLGNGIQPTDRNLKLAHFLGAQGATAFLKGMSQNPSAPAYSLAGPDAVSANQTVFFDKNGNPKSAVDMYRTITAGHADTVTAAAGQNTQLAGPVPSPDSAPVQTAQAAPAPAQQGPGSQMAPQTPAPRLVDPTLGGLVPPQWQAQGPGAYLQYLRGRAASITTPAAKAAWEKQAEAVASAMGKYGEPTPEQKNFHVDARPGETQTSYAARAAGEKEMATKDVDSFQKKYDASQKLGHAAAIGLHQAQLGSKMVEDSNFYSGPFEPTVRLYKQFASVTGSDPNKALSQEGLNKIANGMLTESIAALGGSGVGQVRVAEVKIMQQAIANLGITPAANRLLLELAQRTYKDNMEVAKIMREHRGSPGSMNQTADQKIAEFYEKHPLLSEAEKQDFRLIAPPTFKSPTAALAAGIQPGSPIRTSDGRILYMPGAPQ